MNILMTHFAYICVIILGVILYQVSFDRFYDRAIKNGAILMHPKTGKMVWRDEVVVVPVPVPVEIRSKNNIKEL
jgi:hypothetical protein